MAFFKKQKIGEILIFSFLVAFPFGRLLAFEFPLFGFRVSFLILDLIAFFGFASLIFSGKIKSYFSSSNFLIFLTPFSFSFIFGFFLFQTKEVLIGFFYLLRLISYLGFSIFLADFFKKEKRKRIILENSLILILFFSLLFGFVQYFLYPDLTSLKFLGWDDHLFRMTGTFLDPGFTGIIFVFGFLFSFINYKFEKSKKFIFLALLFLIGISLTFSRASYLALITAIFYLSFALKEFKPKFFLLILLFIFILFLIPKPKGEGVNLARLYSIFDRFENYQETIQIFSHSPVFGVGFNNLCLAKKIYLQNQDVFSHSCGGSDSSILLVLASLGVFGFLILFYLSLNLWKMLEKDKLSLAIKASILALLIHSQFNASLFYPWVLGFLAVVFALKFSAKIER
jgi:O-antigen ligase